MSIAYEKRRKAIRDEKRRTGEYPIPEKDFYYLQAKWEREITGPPIGTLADLMEARR